MSSEADKSAKCTLCPAGCRMALVKAAPRGAALRLGEPVRLEYPTQIGSGICPRGSAIGELLTHRRRILAAGSRAAAGNGSRRHIDLPKAAREIVRACGRGVTVVLDGNIPCEQLAEAAGWVRSWQGAKICFAIEPADEQLLLGLEAGGTEYLAADKISECDGYLIIGDVFSANPTLAKGVLDRYESESKTPIVVIDAAGGKASKFATHVVSVSPGAIGEAVGAVAAAAGVDVAAPSAGEFSSAVGAGKAIAACKRLGVLIAAEYGRSASWRQIGFVAGRLAKARGGAAAPETAGMNALAAVRLAPKLGAVDMAEALSGGGLVVVGCDLLGMLGLPKMDVVAAAAALPNRTTDAAAFVLPMAMPGEYGGTYLAPGRQPERVAGLVPAPAGVPNPCKVVASLASAAGASKPDIGSAVAGPDARDRLEVDAPAPAGACADCDPPVLLFARQAAEAGRGELTSHATYQRAIQPLPEAKISPAMAARLNLKNLSVARIEAGGRSLQARLRVLPETPDGVVVLPESCPQARALNPLSVDGKTGAFSTGPVSCSISI